MHRSRSQHASPALIALLISGLLGFHLGYTHFADWQIPVESGQVLAGLVTYPVETPFYVHHMKLWTVLHQVCAILLAGGLSEITVSRIMSGLLGMLSLQALSLFVVAFSGRALASIGAAFLLFVSDATYAGAVYPIFLMGVPFTYGVVGLSLVVLIAASAGCGLHRTAAFLLALAPAVHTGLAVWLWIIVAIVLLVDWRRLELKPALPAFVAGAALTGVSYAVHAWMSAGVPADPAVMDRRYLDAFTAFWDGHRRPVGAGEVAVLLNVAAVVVSTWWLRAFRTEVTRDAAFLLRFVQIAALVSLALVPFTWLPPERLPVPLLVLMPGRVLNINAMTFAAMVIGLLASSQRQPRQIVLLLMTGALLLGADSLLWQVVPGGRPGWLPAIPTHGIPFVAAAALIVIALIERRQDLEAIGISSRVRLLRAATLGLFALSLVATYRVRADKAHVYIDRTNNAVLAAASAGQGLLLTIGDMHLFQLRTRRPMLVDTGALDTIPYTPGSGPVLHRILRDIYGIDLFDPPGELRGAGRLLPNVHRLTWQQFSGEDWKRIRREFHVTQVLTTADWQLDLPIVAGDRRYLLYAIPE